MNFIFVNLIYALALLAGMMLMLEFGRRIVCAELLKMQRVQSRASGLSRELYWRCWDC